jgi:2-polyprenyl-3-methyl-5-hydroxy-6-metoxy-1,4-benzoquinol methylase
MAELCRAKELHLKFPELKANIFSSFEMLEHLFDPISFMHNMATKAECELFVVTIPYVKQSRLAKHMSGKYLDKGTNAENTHIFELSPEDWNRIFNFSGWKVIYSDKYRQYPQKSILNLTKFIWRKIDFDGFYGVILEKDLSLANRYKDW